MQRSKMVNNVKKLKCKEGKVLVDECKEIKWLLASSIPQDIPVLGNI